MSLDAERADGTRIRTFLAVDLDHRVKRQVGAWTATLAAHLGAAKARHVKWIPAGNLHLTLHFFGALTPTEVATVSAALEPEWPVGPFDLQIEGSGTFPPRGAPRVIWLGVKADGDALVRLRAEVERRLTPIGLAEIEGGRPHAPHLTIGRLRPKAPAGVGRDVRIMLTRPGLEPASCSIDRLTLFESRLSPRGPSYHQLADYPLTQR